MDKNTLKRLLTPKLGVDVLLIVVFLVVAPYMSNFVMILCYVAVGAIILYWLSKLWLYYREHKE
jgi:uncharacterized membrane protein YqgA involved in biofilm formation